MIDSIRQLLVLYRLRKRLRQNPDFLYKLQQKRLRSMIKHAYENVPFYHKKFDGAGIKPDDIKSIDDLTKIPITTKREIQACNQDDIIARNFNKKECQQRKTSGSTGIPLIVYVDNSADAFRKGVWLRTFFENGLSIRDRMAIIGSPSYERKQRLRIMRRKHISIFDETKNQHLAIKNYKPDVIKGWSSSLVLLADYCRQNNEDIKTRLIFTGAELLDARSRSLISSTFEASVLDNYGTGEFSLLAWECHEHSYHMNTDVLAIEFLDGDEAVSPGELGEIVCTCLVNYPMPLIRYKLDDVGVFGEKKCPCGVTLPIMKTVEGRKDDFLTSLDGKIIPPIQSLGAINRFFIGDMHGGKIKFPEIKQIRLIQERIDKLTVQIAVEENARNILNPNVLEEAKKSIERVFGEGIQVDFQILDEIDRDPSGKLRTIISKVPNRFNLISIKDS